VAAALSTVAWAADRGVTQTVSEAVAPRFTKPVLHEPAITGAAVVVVVVEVVVVGVVDEGAGVAVGAGVGAAVAGVGAGVAGVGAGATVVAGVGVAGVCAGVVGAPTTDVPPASICSVKETVAPHEAGFMVAHTLTVNVIDALGRMPPIVKRATFLLVRTIFVTGLPVGEDQPIRTAIVGAPIVTFSVDFLMLASRMHGAAGSAHVVAAIAGDENIGAIVLIGTARPAAIAKRR
jgi:hypothetical protein